MNVHYLYSNVFIHGLLQPVYLAAIWEAIWFQLGISLLVIGIIIYCLTRIRKLNNRLIESEQELVTRTEVLDYTTISEQKAKEEVQLANRTKSQLIARISHEIRTPMNNILGSSDLLSETTLTKEQAEYIHNIHSSGEKLLSTINDILIEDILDFSLNQSGRLALEQKEFDLQNTIEEVLEQFANRAAELNIELLNEVAPNVPHFVIGDNLRLRQVLIKLIENAVQFTENGEVLVRVRLGTIEEDNHVQLHFEVHDTGSGIPADKRALIAKNLFHTNSQEEIVPGIGLGLIICKRLVALMGGTIHIESSKPNEGTVIAFTIVTKASPAPLSAYMQTEVELLTNKKILLVDDHAKSLQLLRAALLEWNTTPTVASSATEALEILAKPHSFDVVVTDYKMPIINGVEFAKQVKQADAKLAFILLNTPDHHLFHNDQELFSAVITKPVKKQLLRKHILHAVEQKYNLYSIKRGNAVQQLSETFAEKYPLRILVAEDNEINQKLMTRILNKLGYTPEMAGNGQEALEIVSDQRYDVILMDVKMPEMDGLEATRMIRLCLTAQPVIIAMTANAMEGDREECLQAGMDDYISKPVNLQLLISTLEKWALVIKQK